MQAHPQQEQLSAEQLVTEGVLACATESQQRAVALHLALEASGPHVSVPVGCELAHDQARKLERMVSVKAQQRCTCHPSQPNLEVLHALQLTAQLRPQAPQRDLQVHDRESERLCVLFPVFQASSSTKL